MKKHKKFIFASILSLLLALVMFTSMPVATTYAQTYNEQERIAHEIEDDVEDGYLPEWHLNYKNYPYYQKIYLKFCKTEERLNYFGSLTETRLRELFNMYIGDTQFWNQIVRNLKLDLEDLETNATIGIYFDGQFVYLIWTSEYIPNELINLKSVTYTINGHTETVTNGIMINGVCEHMQGDSIFELTESLYIMGQNQEVKCQLNMTPIMSYHKCGSDITGYGVPLEGYKVFTINNWTAELDHTCREEDDDPENYYTFDSDGSEVTFRLSEAIKYEGNPVYQLSTHVYVTITDCICQSYYDLNFGGYQHFVYFNTNLDLEKVYRVDCAYTLLADDEIWAAKLLTGRKDQIIHKSLSEDKARGGFLDLTRYQGLTDGDFSSNDLGSKHYRYRLMLNYDESNWDISEILETTESDYKRVEEFYVLRLDFLYEGEELDMEIYMDAIGGDDLKIYNRELVLDTTSAVWKFKDHTFEQGDIIGETITDVIDDVGEIGTDIIDTGHDVIEGAGDVITDVTDTAGNIIEGIIGAITGVTGGVASVTGDSSKIKKTLLISAGCILGVVLIYFIYKLVKFLKRFFSKNDDKKKQKNRKEKNKK